MGRLIPSHVHGTPGGYKNWGCRCEACTRMHAVKQAEGNQARRSRPVPIHVHGTSNGYTNYGCRCSRCRDAHTVNTREYRHRSRTWTE